MTSLDRIIARMESNPKGVRFRDLCKVCDAWFGEARIQASSHRIYKTPWPGDPRVNIQDRNGMAKAYQVKQVLLAIALMEKLNGKSAR